jgi:hypothetical protein
MASVEQDWHRSQTMMMIILNWNWSSVTGCANITRQEIRDDRDVFRSRLRPGAREEYIALVDRMVELAKTMPGYISHKGFFCRRRRGGLPLSNSSTKRGCVPGA